MDVLICTALKDCYFLKKNIPFIVENINPEKIFIITDSRNFKFLKALPSNVILLDENKIIEGLDFHTIKGIIDHYLDNRNYGWYFQQFLKLGFALSPYSSEEYLVWDADTVPLSRLTFKDAKGHYMALAKKEHHQPYFDTIDNLFDAPVKADYSFIGEHMVFNKAIVRELINLIVKNSLEQIPWFERCIQASKRNSVQVFSEFETYGTYCLNYHPGLYTPRTFQTFRFGSRIFGVVVSKDEIQSLAFDLDTVSFEMFDVPVAFTRRIRQRMMYLCFKFVKHIRIKFPSINI